MIFFFKQKTAYELRICDWSSDVCSSDLADLLQRIPASQVGLGHQRQPVVDFPGGAEGVDAGQGQPGARGAGDVGAAGGDERGGAGHVERRRAADVVLDLGAVRVKEEERGFGKACVSTRSSRW